MASTLWRRSLRTSCEDAATEHTGDDHAETLWITALDSLSLPIKHRQSALPVLQSLLIQGPLSVEDLRLTSPFVGSSQGLQALIGGGVVRLRVDMLTCMAATYSTFRRELSNAGFSMDRFLVWKAIRVPERPSGF